MRGDGSVFDHVEMATDLAGRMDAMVQVGDKGCDGSFEVNVVLPKRVIRVDEESLAGGATGGVR